ncbi:MAG: M50 family metallopeptidase [Candidatus Dormibacteraeota bacterium]|nr:M50 family metallopeptidase [Candidatus Dormibacteraeota bacterium]
MSTLLNWLLVAVAIGGMFLILIAPHEGGHFLAAKLFKVRVIEFSIGAGPKLLSFVRGGTLYALRLLPILGYVRMGGMEAGDFDQPGGFHSKPPLQRIAILAAGPIANFIVAILLVTGFGLTQLNSDPGKVQRVLAGRPAALAGLQVGDSIRSVNGKPVTAPGFISQEENAHPGLPLVLTGVHPDGKPFTVTVVPICNPPGTCQIGIGVAPRLVTVQSAVIEGVTFPIVAMDGIVQGLDALVTGKIQGGLLGPQGLTGPIGIGAITAAQVNQGPPAYIFLVALLSVALGFTNLLPLLALDGGRIVVVIIEWLRRRPFDRKSELNFQRWGLVALLGLAAVISFLDVQRILSGQFTGVH